MCSTSLSHITYISHYTSSSSQVCHLNTHNLTTKGPSRLVAARLFPNCPRPELGLMHVIDPARRQRYCICETKWKVDLFTWKKKQDKLLKISAAPPLHGGVSKTCNKTTARWPTTTCPRAHLMVHSKLQIISIHIHICIFGVKVDKLTGEAPSGGGKIDGWP